jgi:hypothetical protein
MTDWRWNETAHRYQDAETGRFISHTYALGLIQESIRQAIFATDTLAGYVSAGQIAIPDWTQLMRTEIKNEYIRQYLAGIGGRSQMTQADWGKIGNLLKNQYSRLDSFAASLPGMSEAQIRVRAAMYSESAGQAYEMAHAKVAKGWGADTAAWFVDPSLENCDVCLERQRMGPRPIGPRGGFMSTVDGEVFPKDCTAPCLVHDGCFIEFSNSKTGQVYEEGEITESLMTRIIHEAKMRMFG